MPDLAVPDALPAIAGLIRSAGVLPATAVLATEYTPGAPATLPTGITTYLLLTDVASADRGDGWRVDLSLQLDVWAPDRSTGRTAWEAVRRYLCRRGVLQLPGGGSAARTVVTLYPIGAPSEAPALTRTTSLLALTVSGRGGI